MKGVNTFKRYVYLNVYALLLLAAGAGVGFLPLWRVSPWAVAGQALVVLPCLYNGLRILATWDDKKRKYALLMQRNADGLRPDTFTDYMQAPCGRALVRVVLADLGCSEEYAGLQRLKKPLRERMGRQKTVVYMPSSRDMAEKRRN